MTKTHVIATAPGEKNGGERPHLRALPLAADLSGPGPHAVCVDGLDLVLVRTQAGLRAFQGQCPHQGALLGEGEIEGGALVCRNHRWRFNVTNGHREGGPECLVACPTTERDGRVFVDVSPLAAAAEERSRAPQSTTARPRRGLHNLPGPRGLPLVGNGLQLDLDTLHLTFERWADAYGSVYAFRLGRQRAIVVSDPELAQQVLRARPDTFRRTSKLERVFQELGVAGVFAAEGAAWRSQRRLAMEALAQRHLRGFYPTLATVATRLRRHWEAAAVSGTPVDIVEDLKRFTVDVTTALTFGQDINTIEQTGDDVIQRRLELIFPAFNRRIFALVPLWRFVRMPRDRRLDRALADLRAWLDGLVRDARVGLLADPARAQHPSNFLDAMLTARDQTGQPFSDEVVFANLMTMLLAGEDTTAYTLAWAVHHLADSPDAVAALHAELDAAVDGAGVPADLDVTGRLVYTGAVANEAMRLRPVAPIIALESLMATTLSSAAGDIELPAHTGVIVLTRPPVRDAARFRHPDQFRPQRWLDAVPSGAHDAAVYIPFGTGPRICPGRSLALVEMKVVLSMLYRCFHVTRVGLSADVGEHFSFTMSPTDLKVILRPRDHAGIDSGDG